jgi:hypothetical protein
MTEEKIDKTSMSYWFPKLEAAGLPVPRTESLTMSQSLCINILRVLYGEKTETDPREHSFFPALRVLVARIGTPCFLRTAHTSAKHSWSRACFLENSRDLVKHVYEIAEFSECAGLMGLPFDKWFVRELLPSIKFGVCPRYSNMPVAREFRFFVEGGSVRCFHPYWPLESLTDGGWTGTAEEYARLCDPAGDEGLMRDLAVRVSNAIEGAWSVDLLQTEKGWYVTDMAEAARSFHWEGCPNVD